MTQHRVLHDDGSDSCYACGIHADNVPGSSPCAPGGPFDRLPCRPGGWDHPPYVLGVDRAGRILTETCAAHPYRGCTYDAPILAALSDDDAEIERSTCSHWRTCSHRSCRAVREAVHS